MTSHATIAASIIEPVLLCSELGALGLMVLVAVGHTVVHVNGVFGGSFDPLTLEILHLKGHVMAIPIILADR